MPFILALALASFPVGAAGSFSSSVSLLPRFRDSGNVSRQRRAFFGAFLPALPPFASSTSSASATSASGPMAEHSSPPPVRWGIVGLGDVVSVKSGPPFWKCNGSELVAVMRRTPGAAAEWARKNVPGNGCSGYDDVDAFLAHPGLDAVYICTPPGSHLEIAKKVAAAGLHGYLEKPVGRCAHETIAIARAFEQAGTTLFTAYVSRAYERTDAVRRLLADGAIGDRVASIEYVLQGTGGARGMDDDGLLPWRLDAARSGGGLVMDVGCHLVDRLDYLFGPLVNVSGSALNRRSPGQPVEDFVRLSARVGRSDWAAIPSEGAPVTCTWDFAPDKGVDPVDELTIVGTNGRMLKMAAMSPSAPVAVTNGEGSIVKELSFQAPQHAAQSLIQSICDEIRGLSGAPSCPSRSDNSIRTSKALDEALKGYYGGRDDQFWSRPESWPGKRQMT